YVAKHPAVFSASLGGVVVEDLDSDQLAMMRMMLLAMDPPGHAKYRRPLVPHFGRQAIAELEDRVRAICREVLGGAREGPEIEFGDGPMSDVDFGSFFVQLVTAGNDTTKTMLSSGLHALLTHPDQMADVRADRSLIPGAVEEILRWANPLHYFRRTASEDTELAG